MRIPDRIFVPRQLRRRNPLASTARTRRRSDISQSPRSKLHIRHLRPITGIFARSPDRSTVGEDGRPTRDRREYLPLLLSWDSGHPSAWSPRFLRYPADQISVEVGEAAGLQLIRVVKCRDRSGGSTAMLRIHIHQSSMITTHHYRRGSTNKQLPCVGGYLSVPCQICRIDPFLCLGGPLYRVPRG